MTIEKNYVIENVVEEVLDLDYHCSRQNLGIDCVKSYQKLIDDYKIEEEKDIPYRDVMNYYNDRLIERHKDVMDELWFLVTVESQYHNLLNHGYFICEPDFDGEK